MFPFLYPPPYLPCFTTKRAYRAFPGIISGLGVLYLHRRERAYLFLRLLLLFCWLRGGVDEYLRFHSL